MFVGIEIDPESGSINNIDSVFAESTLKKAVKHMKKHFKDLLLERSEGLEGVTAYIIDTERMLVVIDLVVYTNYAQLEASVSAGSHFTNEVPGEYFDGIKIDEKATQETCDIPVFKKFSWK